MTAQTNISDEELVALADGELSPAEEARLRAAIARDPELASRFADFVETRFLLEAERAEQTSTPSATVVPLQSRRASPRVPSSRWAMPLAASIALLIGGTAGFIVGSGRERAGGGSPALSPAVARALDATPSGQTITADGGRRVVMIASQLVDGDVLCREYQLESGSEVELGVACRRAGGWRIELVVREPPASQGTFTPARGQDMAERYLETLGGRGALTPEAERQALGARAPQ